MRTRLASVGARAGTDSLLKSGYLIALLLVLVPVVDVLTRTWPVRPREEMWRFGFLGIAFNAMVTPLLGVFLGMVIAAALDHRRMLWAITFVTFAAAAGSAVAMGTFLLDYVQMRANITAAAMRSFDGSAWKAIAVGLASVVAAVVLGLSGWRTARRISSARDADNVGLMIPKEEKA